MVITGSSVAVRCWRRPLAWPRTPAVSGPRLSAAGTSGATEAAQAASTADRAATAGHDAGRVAPRAQGPPRPPRNRIAPSVRNGPAALGPRYPRPGEAARTCDACQGLVSLDFSELLNPKFQGRKWGIPITANYLCQNRVPVSGYILINRSASACRASASVTWKNFVCLGSPATTQLFRQRVPR